MHLPLTVPTKDDATALKHHLAALLGDSLKHPTGAYPADVTVPDPLPTDKALSTAPPRVSGNSLGSLLTFKSGGPFAMVHFSYKPSEGAQFSFGGHAGWQKYGSVADIEAYHQALDQLLNRLGVLPEQYRFSCPCGTAVTIDGSHTAVHEFIETHNATAHDDSRISTTTLVKRTVTIPDEPTPADATCQTPPSAANTPQ